MRGVLNTTLCDKVCQSLVAGWWYSAGTLVSSANKTDCNDITEILLKVALSTKTLTLTIMAQPTELSNMFPRWVIEDAWMPVHSLR